MRLHHISLGNLRRRKGKAFLLFAGLCIGIALVTAMRGITARMQQDVERRIDEYGANIIITPKSGGLPLTYGGVDITDASFDVQRLKNSDIALIKSIHMKEKISAVAPKVIGSYRIRENPFLVVGVDFSSEFRIKKWWQLKGQKPSSSGEILLGAESARRLGATPGGNIELGGRQFRVAGVLVENASQDDSSVFMDMREAQALLGKRDEVSVIEVSALCSGCPIDDIVAQISHGLPHAKVSPIRQAMALRMQTVEQLSRFSLAASLVVVVIGSLVVFVSMLSSVNERTREIGVLRAIGFRKAHIVKVIMMEAFVISLAAGLGGWVFGGLSVSLLASELPVSGGAFMLDPAMPLVAVGMALLIGLLSSLYPALKASRLEPLEALRYI
jgi:putative ABC transport system permease protein